MSLRHDRIALLDRYTRIPTISRRVTPEMVEQVRALWREQGLELEPLFPPGGAAPTGGWGRNATPPEYGERGTPCLYGEIPGPPGAPTVLLYGHYDTQPTGDLAKWVWNGVPCPPFEPVWFLDGAPAPPAAVAETDLDRLLMVARGGCDNKGQHMANILGALDAARAGTLQWHVKVLLEGEEESGSPTLRELVAHHRERLAADICIGSDGPKQRNRPTIVMGVRGLLGVDIVAENSAPASVHSGNYGNIVPNPFLPLARLVEDIGLRVRAYAEQHDAFRREAAEVFAEWSDKAMWKPFLWPTNNVNSLISDGASPEQRRTIIPRSIHARMDIRLTTDTPPAAVRAIVEETAADHRGPAAAEGITFHVETGGDYPASYTSPRHPAFDWLLAKMAEDGEEVIALPTLGGSLPAHVFTETLGLPTFWLPAANTDNQQHDINEHYILKHFFQQTALYARIVSSRPG
jgi:acetylornithine deacetylase/succinyl-diaminopimelate desuccinylase-like protein